MDGPRRAHVRARRRRRSRRAFASVSRRRARRSRRDGVVPRALDGVEHRRQRRGGAFQGDGDALAEEETPRRDGGEGGARGCARGGGGGGGGGGGAVVHASFVARAHAERGDREPGGRAVHRARERRPRRGARATRHRRAETRPPRTSPSATRPRRANAPPDRAATLTCSPSASAAGIAAATAPLSRDRPDAATAHPPPPWRLPPRAPRAPPRLAKAADADPPLEVASQEVIRLGEIRTRAHYGPWAHLWWGEVASADDRARSSAFASSSGSAASAAPSRWASPCERNSADRNPTPTRGVPGRALTEGEW